MSIIADIQRGAQIKMIESFTADGEWRYAIVIWASEDLRAGQLCRLQQERGWWSLRPAVPNDAELLAGLNEMSEIVAAGDRRSIK